MNWFGDENLVFDLESRLITDNSIEIQRLVVYEESIDPVNCVVTRRTQFCV